MEFKQSDTRASVIYRSSYPGDRRHHLSSGGVPSFTGRCEGVIVDGILIFAVKEDWSVWLMQHRGVLAVLNAREAIAGAGERMTEAKHRTTQCLWQSVTAVNSRETERLACLTGRRAAISSFPSPRQ